MAELSVKRKADRKAMAEQIIRLATNLNASAYIDEVVNEVNRETWVRIVAAQGLRLTVTLDGQSCQPDVHVLSWHIATGHETKIADSFGANAGVNELHRHKATDVCHGYNDLLKTLDTRLRRAFDGRAFMPEAEQA